MSVTFNLLGAQGSGKGTQAKALLERFDFIHFDAGEALRQIRAEGSPLGKKIASHIDKGQRVPPTLIADVTLKALIDRPKDKDILFDGLLRSLAELKVQHEIFEKLDLPLPVILFLDLDEKTAIERITKRRICIGCGVRRIIMTEDQVEACQRCGGHLETRHDDTPEALRHRLDWYNRDTLPLVDWFRQHGEVIEVDARPSIDEVTEQLIVKVLAYYQKQGLTPPLIKK